MVRAVQTAPTSSDPSPITAEDSTQHLFLQVQWMLETLLILFFWW